MAQGQNGPSSDPGIRAILEELRDLRRAMRDDRRHTEADRRQAEVDRRRSDQRFEQLLQRHEAAFRDIRTVGLAIVKTLNRHTTILERIDRKLGVRGNGGPRRGNGRAA